MEKLADTMLIFFSEQIGMVNFLVSEGANKEAVNSNKQGAVQMAVTSKNVALLRTLRDLKFSANQKVIM